MITDQLAYLNAKDPVNIYTIESIGTLLKFERKSIKKSLTSIGVEYRATEDQVSKYLDWLISRLEGEPC